MSCGNATGILPFCRGNSEMYGGAGWVIGFGLALDTAPNGGFTTRSARSGGPS